MCEVTLWARSAGQQYGAATVALLFHVGASTFLHKHTHCSQHSSCRTSNICCASLACLNMMAIHCGAVTTSFFQTLQLQIGTSGTFDAGTYRQSLAANSALQQQIKEKRHGSAAQEGEHREICASAVKHQQSHGQLYKAVSGSLFKSWQGPCMAHPLLSLATNNLHCNIVSSAYHERMCCAGCDSLSAGGHGGNSGSSCPFATIGQEEGKQQWQRSNYHAKHQSKGMADKVWFGNVVLHMLLLLSMSMAVQRWIWLCTSSVNPR